MTGNANKMRKNYLRINRHRNAENTNVKGKNKMIERSKTTERNG